jgi:hypothetical protein
MTAPLPSNATTSGVTVIDPTVSPSNPTGTSLAVLILGQTASNSVNVSGLSASVQGSSSIQLVIGSSTFNVSVASANQDGSYTLVVSNPAGLSDAVAQNITASVLIGGGASTTLSVTPTLTMPGNSGVTYIDPTLSPQP